MAIHSAGFYVFFFTSSAALMHEYQDREGGEVTEVKWQINHAYKLSSIKWRSKIKTLQALVVIGSYNK